MLRRLVSRPAVATVGLVLTLTMPATALAGSTAGGAATTTAPAPTAPLKPTPTPTPAKTISKEDALAIVQRYFTLPDGPGKIDLSLSTQNGRSVWELMYTITQGNGSTGYGLGTVDATTGKILAFQGSYRELRPLRTGPLGKPYPEEQAKAKAWSLVQAMYPGDTTALRAAPNWAGAFQPGYPSGTYSFSWIPYHNDVPVLGQQVQVTIDRYTGAFLSFNSGNPVELRFPDGSPTVTSESAAARLQAVVTPTLVYRPGYSSKIMPQVTPPNTYTLLYRMDQATALLDAISGQLVDMAGKPVEPTGKPEAVPAAAGAPHRPQTVPVTPDAAIAFAREVFALPADARPQVAAAHSVPYGDQGMTVHWYDDQGANFDLTLDPATGRITSAYRSTRLTNSQDSTPATAEQKAAARAAAIAVVQQYYADLIPDLMQQPLEPSYYSNPGGLGFYFARYHQGILVEGQGVNVTINLSDMTWTQLGSSWNEAEFPSATGCLSADEAKRLYLEGQGAVVMYRPVIDPNRRWDDPGPADLMMTYQLMPQDGVRTAAVIDAFKGNPLGADGRPVEQLSKMETVLSEHWAGGELLAMLDRNAIRQLDPNGPVSRQDALQLLINGVNEMNHYWGAADLTYTDVPASSEIVPLIQTGIVRGVLRPEGPAAVFGPDQSITRAEFALWVTRWLGYGPLTRSKLRATSDFTDLTGLTAEERNAVMLLEALGIVKPGERFRGSEPLTQAEGAVMMVRLLQVQNSK